MLELLQWNGYNGTAIRYGHSQLIEKIGELLSIIIDRWLIVMLAHIHCQWSDDFVLCGSHCSILIVPHCDQFKRFIFWLNEMNWCHTNRLGPIFEHPNDVLLLEHKSKTKNTRVHIHRSQFHCWITFSIEHNFNCLIRCVPLTTAIETIQLSVYANKTKSSSSACVQQQPICCYFHSHVRVCRSAHTIRCIWNVLRCSRDVPNNKS